MSHGKGFGKASIGRSEIYTVLFFPHLIRLHSHQFQKFFVSSFLAEPHITVRRNLIKIQKFIIQTVFQIIRPFRDQTGHRSGNTVSTQVFHNTDSLISLLDIEPVHKFIGHNRILNSVLYLMIVKI